MKTVLIVESPFYSFFKYDQWYYSFSSAYIASAIDEAGHKTYIYDADKYFEKDPSTKNRVVMVEKQDEVSKQIENFGHEIWGHYTKMLREINPDVVLFSSWTFKLRSTLAAIDITKETLPGCKIAVGGYHATALPHSFSDNPNVDAVFTGMAEDDIVKWLNGDLRRGIYAHTAPVTKESLKLKFHPNREAFIHKEFFSPVDFSLTLLSRGCHSNCSFCCNKMLSGQFHVFADDEYIRDELDVVVHGYNNKSLHIGDAHFFDSKRMYEVLEIIKSYGVSWTCSLRADSVSEKLIDAFMDSGCNLIFAGLERGRNDLLEKINKKLRVEQVRAMASILNSKGLNWRCSFIIGLPDDDVQSINDTRDFALSLGASHVSLNSFTPLPGSDIWGELSKEHSEKTLLSNYNQLNPVASFIKSMPKEEYSKIFKETLADFEKYNDSKNGRELLHL